MSIASRIQEIETHIGDVYDTINYSYDTTGINKNIINIPKYLKKGYIDIINNGIDNLYNNFPKVSGTGSNLSLTPTYEAPMGISVYGDTYQNGTPTPSSPVPMQSVTGLQNVNVCGKNLCFNITKPSNANLKFFINKPISKTFTISFTTNEALNGNSLYLEVDGTSYGNLGGITASANTKVEKTYTLSDANYQAIENGTNIDLLLYKNGANFNIPDDGMVENNSTATSYEPYNGNTYEVNLGKNLLDTSKARLGTFNGLTISYSNGEILLNGTATALVDFYVATKVSSPTYNEDLINYMNNNIGAYTLSNNLRFENYFRIGGSYLQNTGTTTSTNKVDLIFVRIPVGTYNNKVLNIQLEKGSQATSYSSYFTPIELNKIGNYQDSIKKSTGKNLFDKSTITTGKYIDASGNLVNDNSNFVGDYISIDNTKSYYASQSIGGVIRVGYYDSNKSFISRQLITANYDSLTIPNNAVYVRLSCYNQSLDTLQLEIGTQQTSYEPYGKVWYITKNIGKVVLDGTEDWTLNNNYTNNSRFTNNDDILNKTERNVYCNYFVKGTAGQDTTNIDINGSTGKIMITIPNSIATTATALQTWLSNNNVSVIYILNTPTYTVITNEELIKELESIKSKNGTTNISVSSEYLPAILGCSALKVEE